MMQANPAESLSERGAAQAIEPVAEARAHWSLFVPAALVALLYGAVWLALDLGGLTGGALSKLIFLTLIIAPPVLLAYAFLRFQSTGVALTDSHVLMAQGWPHHAAREIALSDIDTVAVRTSLAGRLAGSGGLAITLSDGEEIEVLDLARPHRFAEVVNRRLMGG